MSAPLLGFLYRHTAAVKHVVESTGSHLQLENNVRGTQQNYFLTKVGSETQRSLVQDKMFLFKLDKLQLCLLKLVFFSCLSSCCKLIKQHQTCYLSQIISQRHTKEFLHMPLFICVYQLEKYILYLHGKQNNVSCKKVSNDLKKQGET